MNSDFLFYRSLLLRRLPAMFAVFVLCTGVGIGLAITLPSQYIANARLLVESAQIPDNLASSTVRTAAGEQLQIIEQRLLTRANLIDLANRFDVFEGEERMASDEIIGEMRSRTSVRSTSGRNRATLMTISFTASSPQTSADVVNEFVTLVLNEDVRYRTARAEQTLEFFEQEVERLGRELGDQSARIVGFKEANKNALPDGLTYRLDREARLQERLNLATRDRASLTDQKTRLVSLSSAGVGTNPNLPLTPAQQRVQAAQQELDGLLLIYSETNPRVILARSRLEQLSAAAETPEGTAPGDTPLMTALDVQLAEIDARIDFIDREAARTEKEMLALRAAIEATPENAIQLDALERDYENIQGQYNSATNRLALAQTGERIEVLSKGERITIIEQAVPPTEPTSPNRVMIAGGGAFLGAGLAVALFILSELLNKSVRRPVDLTNALGIQPLATIPFLESASSRRRRRALITIVISSLAIGIPIALWSIHEFYLPLDLVMDRILDKFGI